MVKKLYAYANKILPCNSGEGIFKAKLECDKLPNHQHKYVLVYNSQRIPIRSKGKNKAKLIDGVLKFKLDD